MATVEEMVRLPLRELAQVLRAGDVTAAGLVEHAIARHDALGERLGAYRAFDADRARAQAAAADDALRCGADTGPLAGIPVSVKDLYGVAGWDTYAGTPKPLPEAWQREGPVVRAVRRQLAVVPGKTHTVELAFGGIGTNPHWPTPRNPWDAQEHRVPGGSSSGAGVSLWEGSALLALGTDTAGSVRIPASFTGNVGLKTTAGRWSTDGIVPLSTTLDTAGVLARDVQDAVFAFGALDPRWGDPAAFEASLRVRDASDLRLGVCEELFWDDAGPGVAEGVRGAIAELERAGARVEGFGLPEVQPTYELFRQGGPVSVELHHFLASELPSWMDTLDPNVQARVGDAATLPAHEYLRRLDVMRELGASAAERFRDVDVLVTPTVANGPPTVERVSTPDGYREENLTALRNTCIANYLGLCAVTLPVAKDGDGMPVGLQLVARGGDEEHLLSVARAVEATLGTARQRLGEAPVTG